MSVAGLFQTPQVPPDVIRLAVWVYFRFSLSFRDVEEMLVKIRGEHIWLWRAVDDESEVPDMLVQTRRNTGAALRVLRKLLKRNSIWKLSPVRT